MLTLDPPEPDGVEAALREVRAVVGVAAVAVAAAVPPFGGLHPQSKPTPQTKAAENCFIVVISDIISRNRLRRVAWSFTRKATLGKRANPDPYSGSHFERFASNLRHGVGCGVRQLLKAFPRILCHIVNPVRRAPHETLGVQARVFRPIFQGAKIARQFAPGPHVKHDAGDHRRQTDKQSHTR